MKNLTTKYIKEIILSSRIYKISIYENVRGKLFIDVYIELQYSKNGFVKIVFEDVKKYTFNWEENYYFYYIERAKLFRLNSLYYISFDPDGEEDIISEKDSDFILCSNIDVFVGKSKLDLQKMGESSF